MKTIYKIAVLLTALLLIPIFPVYAEESPAFTIDQRRVLQGMNRSWLQGSLVSVKIEKHEHTQNICCIIIPLTYKAFP